MTTTDERTSRRLSVTRRRQPVGGREHAALEPHPEPTVDGMRRAFLKGQRRSHASQSVSVERIQTGFDLSRRHGFTGLYVSGLDRRSKKLPRHPLENDRLAKRRGGEYRRGVFIQSDSHCLHSWVRLNREWNVRLDGEQVVSETRRRGIAESDGTPVHHVDRSVALLCTVPHGTLNHFAWPKGTALRSSVLHRRFVWCRPRAS